MKKGTVGQTICRLIWILQLVLELMTVGAVMRLNMLPVPYFTALLILLAVLLALTGLMLLPGAKKKHAFDKRPGTGTIRRWAGGFLALAIILGCGLAGSVISDVADTMEGITGAQTTVQVSMAVYVTEHDSAQSISDAAEYTFAALENYETERTEQTADMIRAIVNGDIRLVYYPGLSELVDALNRGEIDALIFNSAYLSLLEDTEDYADLAGNLRVLHTEVIQEAVPVPEQQVTEAPTVPRKENLSFVPEVPFSVTKDAFAVYISGSDTRDYYLSTSRSDVNILVVVNPQTKMILLINTPRDTWISNPAGNGAKDKLTHCGIYGIQCSIGALETLYGVDVHYHAQINFTGLETLVDAIGGVDVYAEYGFEALGTYRINQGWNHLNGEQALAFARDRYHHADGDNARGRNQMKVIKAVIQKATSGTTIVENYSAILKSVEGMFKTNMTSQEIGELVKMQLQDLASWTIVSYALTGEGGSNITYSMPGAYCYVMYPYESRVAYASELIERVYAGEILTDGDMTPKS